jgi:uncharacterized protein YbjQ (UPF0145 family)
MRNLFLIIALTLFSGCLSPNSSHVVTGIARAPIPEGSVKLYTDFPAKCDVIGIVRATTYGDDQKAYDQAISLLKLNASKIGANGVILKPETHGDAWAAGLDGKIPVYYSGQAIFVP